MDLSRVADFADVFAAFGVILSLLLLAHELRMNRKQAELSNWRDLLQALGDYKGITNDLAFSEFLVRANADYAALTPAEQQSFGLYLEQGIHVWGNFLKHNDTVPGKLLGLEEAVFNSLRDLMCTPGAQAWWKISRSRGRFMPQTYVMIDKAMRRSGTS